VIDLTSVIEFVEQGGNEANPHAVPTPTVESLEDSFPRSVAFGQITPRGSGMQYPQYAIDDRTRVVERATGPLVVRTVR
jgi:hypothetical protein